MSQVVIDLSEEVAARLAERARRDHTTPEDIATAAVQSYLGPRRSIPFASLGASGTHDTAARAEEILLQGFGE